MQPCKEVLKCYYFRENDERYLIPEDKIEKFDELCEKLEDLDYVSDEYNECTDMLNNDFSQYVVEGELQEIKLFINPQNLEL